MATSPSLFFIDDVFDQPDNLQFDQFADRCFPGSPADATQTPHSLSITTNPNNGPEQPEIISVSGGGFTQSLDAAVDRALDQAREDSEMTMVASSHPQTPMMDATLFAQSAMHMLQQARTALRTYPVAYPRNEVRRMLSECKVLLDESISMTGYQSTTAGFHSPSSFSSSSSVVSTMASLSPPIPRLAMVNSPTPIPVRVSTPTTIEDKSNIFTRKIAAAFHGMTLSQLAIHLQNPSSNIYDVHIHDKYIDCVFDTIADVCGRIDGVDRYGAKGLPVCTRRCAIVDPHAKRGSITVWPNLSSPQLESRTATTRWQLQATMSPQDILPIPANCITPSVLITLLSSKAMTSRFCGYTYSNLGGTRPLMDAVKDTLAVFFVALPLVGSSSGYLNNESYPVIIHPTVDHVFRFIWNFSSISNYIKSRTDIPTGNVTDCLDNLRARVWTRHPDGATVPAFCRQALSVVHGSLSRLFKGPTSDSKQSPNKRRKLDHTDVKEDDGDDDGDDDDQGEERTTSTTSGTGVSPQPIVSSRDSNGRKRKRGNEGDANDPAWTHEDE